MDQTQSSLPIYDYFTNLRYVNRYYAFAFTMGKILSGNQRNPYGTKPTYGISCGTGDTIEMYCDMEELKMGFIINDEDYGKAFDLDKCKYKAIINMHDKNDSISLL